MKELSIIIPTIRPPNLINLCIESILNTTKDINYEIIVISPIDLSVPKNVRLLKDEGRSKHVAIQLGIEQSKGEYVLTVADYHNCEPDSINNLMKVMRKHEDELFIASPRFKDLDGSIRLTNYLYQVYYASCPCIKKSYIKQIGGFIDTCYLDYFGDIDLSYRVLEQNGKVEIIKDSFLLIRNDLKEAATLEKQKNGELDKEIFEKKWFRGNRVSSNLYTVKDL